MEQAESTLVVILAVFLAIFLLLGITLFVKCLQIIKQMKRIADKAESVGDLLQKASGSLATGRVVSYFADTVLRRKSKATKGKK